MQSKPVNVPRTFDRIHSASVAKSEYLTVGHVKLMNGDVVTFVEFVDSMGEGVSTISYNMETQTDDNFFQNPPLALKESTFDQLAMFIDCHLVGGE